MTPRPDRKSATSRGQVIPQPHGGALVPGAGRGPTPGAPNAGRPPSEVRAALRQAFADRLDATARDIGLRAALDRVVVPTDDIAPMASAAANNSRLIAPNPVAVTAADAERIYAEVLNVTG